MQNERAETCRELRALASGSPSGGVAAGSPQLASSNARWLILGSIAHTVAQWLHFTILARWGGLAAVGTYAFALAVTAPVMGFAALQLPALVATDVEGRYTFRHYTTLTLLTSAGGVLVVFALFIYTAGEGRFSYSVLVPVCAMRVVDLVADLYYGLWQRCERMRVIASSRFLRSGSSVALMWAALALGTGVAGAATAVAVGSIAALVFVHVRTRKGEMLHVVQDGKTSWWPTVGRLAVESFPLGLIVLLGALQANVPRYFIEIHEGKEALGLFAAASQLTSAGYLLITALGSAAIPRLAYSHAVGDVTSFHMLLRKLVLAGAGLGLAAVAASALIGRQVLALVYRPEFAAGADLLVVLSLAAGAWFVTALMGYGLTAARIIAVQPAILTVALAVLVVCCAMLVPRHGAAGAAWSLVAASVVHGVASWMALQKTRVAAARVQ